MADAFGNCQEIALLKIDRTILKLNAQRTFNDVEKLVLSIMRMPDQFAFELRSLEKLVVDLSDDLRGPIIVHPVECGGQR